MRNRVLPVAALAILATSPCTAQVPALPGFCLFARGSAILMSRAGASARRDLDRIAATIATSNVQERQSLINQGTALNKQRAELPPGEFQARANRLAVLAQKLDETIQAFAGKLAGARQAAQARLENALDPVLESVRAEHGCVVVMERNKRLCLCQQRRSYVGGRGPAQRSFAGCTCNDPAALIQDRSAFG